MGILTSKDLWNPNTYYYAKDRYKHMIEHEGSLYVCTSSHISGSTFDNSKFASLSGSGGSGGGELAGTWDMTNTTIPVVFDDFLGCGLTGTGPYTITPDETSSITVASTTTSTAINTPVIFENLINTSTYDPLFVWFGYVNVEATIEDIIAGFSSSQPAPSITFACFGTIAEDNTIAYINSITAQNGNVTDGLAHPSGQSISFKLMLNGAVYELYAKVTSDSTYRLLTSHSTISALNGVKPVLIGIYIGGFTNPITVIDCGGSLVDPATPTNPIGKRYLVNGAGIYKNQAATVGNVVEFIDIDNIFITEDIEDINDGISSIVASLQQEIAARPVTNGVITNTNITGNNNNAYTYVFVANITTEMITVNYPAIPTPYVSFFNLNLRRQLTDNSNLLVRVNFPAGSVDYNPDEYVFTINSSTIDWYDSYHYRFDIMNISSMLFRCVNGMIEYLGYVAAGNTEFSDSLPNGGHTIIIDADTSSTTYNIGNYSDIKHIILNNTTANLVDDIMIFLSSSVVNMKYLPQVNKGMKISIIPGAGSFTNVRINNTKVLFPITPATAGTYHDYVYLPEHDVLVADITNP